MKIGINGFGRIGRLACRVAAERKDIEIVGINDLMDVDYIAYLLKYDSTHGPFKGEVDVVNGQLVINGKVVRVTAERDPEQLKWGELGTDVVLECTGLFLTQADAQKHITAGSGHGAQKSTRFNAVSHHFVSATVQTRHALDVNAARAVAFNLRTHGDQHFGQVWNLGLLRGVFKHGVAFG